MAPRVEQAATSPIPRREVIIAPPGDPVRTEPFDDADLSSLPPAAPAEEQRPIIERLVDEPLPYIAPRNTQPIILDDAAYPDEELAAAVATPDDAAPAVQTPPARRGTLDLGLLILRLGVGVAFLLHGLQKLTGVFGGPGIDGFTTFLTSPGDPSLGFDAGAAHTLAWVGALSETLGGAFLILGLLTPIAGSAVLGVIGVALLYRMTLAGGFSYFADTGGLEYEILLFGAALAVILCGPGRYSFDRPWGWSSRPAWGSALWLLLGIAGALTVWFVFNGANPFAG